MRLALDARTAAFGALIDYAGAFPPASLPIDEAVASYRRLRTDDDRWVLGRFLVRASALEQLAAVATRTMRRGEGPWSVGVIFDVGHGAAASVSHEFQREMGPVMSIGAAEATVRADVEADTLIDSIATIDPDVAAFIEVDRSEPLGPQVHGIAEALRDRGRAGGAKLRCGGTDAATFPTVEEVAEFIWEASLVSLPFKATAGLHQPIRYHDLELDVWRHGFVNLLAASVACDAGEDRSVLEDILSETDPGAFSLGATALAWRDLVYPGSAIRRARREGLVAFGSCDLDEPLTALRDLSFLGEGT